MPQAPVMPAAPAPISNQPAIDLQNLAASLGQFSRSLSDLGSAQLESQRRAEQEERRQDAAIKRAEAEQQAQLEKADRLRKEAEAIRRRNEADAERRADKKQREADRLEAEARRLGERIGKNIDLDDANTIQKLKPQFDKLLKKDEISISEHPAYSEALSIALANRYADRDFRRDAVELESLHNKLDDEIKNPNWFARWYGGRSTTGISNLPDWITDKDAFTNRYLAARSDAKMSLLARHEKVIGVAQIKEEQAQIESETHSILNAALDPSLSIVPEEGEGSVLDPDAFAAAKITKLLDDQRLMGVSTSEDAHKIVSGAIFNWLKAQESTASIEAGIDILERAETGPRDSRTKLLSGEAKVTWDNEVKPAVDARLDKIREIEVQKAFIKSTESMEQRYIDYFQRKIQREAVPQEALADAGSEKLQEVLKGVYSAESPEQAAIDEAFHESFLKLGGKYDPASKTVSFEKDGNKHSFSLTKLAKEAKEAALTEDIVIQRNGILARMKQEVADAVVPPYGTNAVLRPEESKAVFYTQANGEPYPDDAIEVFALAASVRNLQFNESDSVRAQVEQMLKGDYDTEQEALTNLQAAMTTYKILTNNKDTNPTLASDVLGETNAKFLQVAIELHEQNALPGISPIGYLNRAMRDGKFSDAAINEVVNSLGPSGETTVMEDIETEVFNRRLELANVFVPGIGGRGTASAQVTRLARMFSGVAGVEPKRAVDMAMSTITRDMADVGGFRFPLNLLTPTTAMGSSTLMRRNPDWTPPTEEEKLTRKQQQKKRDDFNKAREEYENFWVKHRKIQVFEQKFEPPQPPKFSKSIRQLEELRRRGKLPKGYLQPEEIVPGQPNVERIETVPGLPENDYRIRIPGTYGRFRYQFTKEYKDFQRKLLKLENKLRETEGKEPLGYDEYRKRVPLRITEKLINDHVPFVKYEPTANFEVDVLRKDPGNMTGVEMLNLATEAFRIGSRAVGTKGRAAELYNEAFRSVGRTGSDRFVFVPVAGRKDRFILLRPTESAMTTVPRPNEATEYSLAEIALIAQARLRSQREVAKNEEELRELFRSQKTAGDGLLRFGGR